MGCRTYEVGISLQRPDVRGRQKSQLEGWREGHLCDPQVQPAMAPKLNERAARKLCDGFGEKEIRN